MFKYIIKRIGLMLVTIFIILTILFTMIRMLPDQIPSEGLGNEMHEALRQMRKAWGYDKPIMVQYVIFLKNIITEWDWGFCTKAGTYLQPVMKFVAEKLPATIYVNILSFLISIPLGIIFGIYAALKKNKWQDHIISVVVILFISVPNFVYAFLVQYIFSFKLNVLPAVMNPGNKFFTWSMFKSVLLPVMSLSFVTIASLMRFVRAELTETLTSEYMLLARTKGLTRGQATFRHAFRNSLVPIMPMIIGLFIDILGGSLIIEKIFSIPGIGGLYLQSIYLRDYSIFIAVSMFYTVVGLVAGLFVDVSYGLIDPRIRMGGGKTNE